MAKVRKNIVIEGISGTLGDQLVIKVELEMNISILETNVWTFKENVLAL